MSTTTARPAPVFKRAAWENLLAAALFRLGRLAGATYSPNLSEQHWARWADVTVRGHRLRLGALFTRERGFLYTGSWHLRILVGVGGRVGAGYIGGRTLFVCRNAQLASATYWEGTSAAQEGKTDVWPSQFSRPAWQVGITNNSNAVPCPTY